MNKKMILMLGLLVMVIAGCGLMSATIFTSQEVGTMSAHSSSPNLDDITLSGKIVNFADNSDLDNVDIDGVEDLCIVTVASNHLATPVEGQVWVTSDTSFTATSLDSVRAHGGFIIFEGIALDGMEVHTFTCTETLSMFVNLDLLAPLLARKYFKVWVLAEQGPYDFEFANMYIGMHVTGSL